MGVRSTGVGVHNQLSQEPGTLNRRIFLPMKQLLRSALLLLASGTLFAQSSPEPQKKPTVMVVGMFHMGNPGHDIFNLHVDDVLQPKRQQEIAEVVQLLAKFHPTKIAIEQDLGSPKIKQRYADYLDGKFTLTANEVYQLGFRLAKQLGHKEIYTVDVDGDFPWEPVVTFAKEHGQSKLIDEAMEHGKSEIATMQDKLDHGTILDLLRYLNADGKALQDHQFYMELMTVSGDGKYPGPDLNAEWYRRNARIFSNIRHLVTGPEDRILVLYGSGHDYWLQRDVLDSTDLDLAKFSDLR